MVVRERPSLRVQNLDPDETKQQVFQNFDTNTLHLSKFDFLYHIKLKICNLRCVHTYFKVEIYIDATATMVLAPSFQEDQNTYLIYAGQIVSNPISYYRTLTHSWYPSVLKISIGFPPSRSLKRSATGRSRLRSHSQHLLVSAHC